MSSVESLGDQSPQNQELSNNAPVSWYNRTITVGKAALIGTGLVLASATVGFLAGRMWQGAQGDVNTLTNKATPLATPSSEPPLFTTEEPIEVHLDPSLNFDELDLLQETENPQEITYTKYQRSNNFGEISLDFAGHVSTGSHSQSGIYYHSDHTVPKKNEGFELFRDLLNINSNKLTKDLINESFRQFAKTCVENGYTDIHPSNFMITSEYKIVIIDEPKTTIAGDPNGVKEFFHTYLPSINIPKEFREAVKAYRKPSFMPINEKTEESYLESIKNYFSSPKEESNEFDLEKCKEALSQEEWDKYGGTIQLFASRAEKGKLFEGHGDNLPFSDEFKSVLEKCGVPARHCFVARTSYFWW